MRTSVDHRFEEWKTRLALTMDDFSPRGGRSSGRRGARNDNR
jgi:hypothetical protein